MVSKTRPFIDKKNASTFQVVHRSQRDPKIADETASKLILKEVLKKNVHFYYLLG